MEKRRLGKSGISVSSVCMGTMTFGTSTNEDEAFKIMDYAYDQGIDFFDTAEIYPVPPQKELSGITEEIVGRWLKTKLRETVVLATKIAGPRHGWFEPPVRNGKTSLDRHNIIQAVEGSLKRLQTDYIDLYQTHWPDHGMPPEETLSALDELIKAGKIRVIGCSNETCWGLMNSLKASEKYNLPRYNTVQNSFSLINRRAESELAQVCKKEGVSLLPYSPLAMGVLTGKYSEGLPEDARFSTYLKSDSKRHHRQAERYVNPRSVEATKLYMELAKEAGVNMPAFALAWSKQHEFVASTIIGARTLEQLEESLQGANLVLDKAILKKIKQVDQDFPTPVREDGLRRL